MQKVSYAGCLGLFLAITAQFAKTCVATPNREKFTKTPNFRGSRSFKVIDVNKTKKPVTIACHEKQHVCTFLQPFSHYTSQYQQNNVFLRNTFL